MPYSRRADATDTTIIWPAKVIADALVLRLGTPDRWRVATAHASCNGAEVSLYYAPYFYSDSQDAEPWPAFTFERKDELAPCLDGHIAESAAAVKFFPVVLP